MNPRLALAIATVLLSFAVAQADAAPPRVAGATPSQSRPAFATPTLLAQAQDRQEGRSSSGRIRGRSMGKLIKLVLFAAFFIGSGIIWAFKKLMGSE